MSALLSFEDVTLRRGGRLLFERLSLKLNAGDAIRLTGPNGSGKSSLLRLAAGLLRSAGGTVERAPLALADDKPALDFERPLGEALRFWAGRDPQPALDALGIAHLVQVPVRYLSSGQIRRASLARVIASDARLWLLDEPANALDEDGMRRLGAAIAGHRSGGGAVVAASHLQIPGAWRELELGA